MVFIFFLRKRKFWGCSYGWRMNVPVLADSFVEHIGRFPDVGQAKFEGDVLFVAGGASDYVR